MKLSIENLTKFTLKFILFKHFTNGFVIWSYALFGFYFIREIPAIALFRTALWYDQAMWIFLIPMLFQNWFVISTKIPLKKIKFRNKIDNFLLPCVVGGSTGLIFVSYAFFVWDVSSIIPADFRETWSHESIDYDTFSVIMLIGSHINSGTAIMLLRFEQFFKQKYSIPKIPLWPKKLENRVIMMIFGLVIPLIIFVIYNWLLEPRFIV